MAREHGLAENFRFPLLIQLLNKINKAIFVLVKRIRKQGKPLALSLCGLTAKIFLK